MLTEDKEGGEGGEVCAYDSNTDGNTRCQYMPRFQTIKIVPKTSIELW